jgi:hypothetical protein
MRSLIYFFLMVFCVVIAPAQEKIIGQAEFDAAVVTESSNRQKWAGTGETYRMTVTNSAKIIEKPESDYSSKMVFEYGVNGEVRDTNSSTFGGKTTTSESLRVGKWIYYRTGTEPWARKERQPIQGNGQGSGSGCAAADELVSSETEYKYLGSGDIKGEVVRVYARTVREKKVNRTTGKFSDSVISSKYWINADGFTLKHELVSENRWERQNSRNRIVTEWEFDPTMVFTPPEIAPRP